MRRPLALLALLVTTWSNAAVLRCAAMAPASGEPQASTEHHGHGARTPDARDETGHTATKGGPGSPPPAQECGLVMACGTALNGTGATFDRELPGPLGRILLTPAAAHTTADLSKDPPPPRRLARSHA